MDKKIENIKAALEQKPSKMPLHRHHDDDYVDEVYLSANGARLRTCIKPRYKTSGLSGNEWRIRAVLDVFKGAAEEPFFSRSFHSMRRLFEYAPKFIYSDCRDVLDCSTASLIVRRKGVTLFQQWFPTFGEPAIGLGWYITIANEGTEGVEWHHLTDAEEREHCQQVGCGDPPVNFYHLKKLQAGNNSLMIEPEYDFIGQYTWYCARHTERGDCGLEDADDNMELVSGTGVPLVRLEDESPSGFAGAIEVKLPDFED